MSDLFKLSKERLSSQLQEIKQAYINFVIGNPTIIQQIEGTAKASSYLFEALSGNYQTSIFISEIVSVACNLFAYANSCLLLRDKKKFSKLGNVQLMEKLKQTLSIVEFSQTFIEISAKKVGGNGARWAVITIICILKAILRCILLFLFDSGIQTSSLISTSTVMSQITKGEDNSEDEEMIYIGSRSGHRVRTLAASKSPMWSSSSFRDKNDPIVMSHSPSSRLNQTEKIGETLHAIRPLLHVMATGIFGTKSFAPWLTALVIDTSSHALLQRTMQSRSRVPYNHVETKEIQRRYIGLLLYLIRSPMYEKYTGTRLLGILNYLSEHVPLARYVVEPFSKYIPEWQKIYFYTWLD